MDENGCLWKDRSDAACSNSGFQAANKDRERLD